VCEGWEWGVRWLCGGFREGSGGGNDGGKEVMTCGEGGVGGKGGVVSGGRGEGLVREGRGVGYNDRWRLVKGGGSRQRGDGRGLRVGEGGSVTEDVEKEIS